MSGLLTNQAGTALGAGASLRAGTTKQAGRAFAATGTMEQAGITGQAGTALGAQCISAPAPQNTAALVVKNLSASYGKVPVLHNITLAFEPGVVTAVLGANGSGKSTLLSLVSGIALPRLTRTGGTVTYGGADSACCTATQGATTLKTKAADNFTSNSAQSDAAAQDVLALAPKERARIIGFLPQNESCAWNYTVLDTVLMGRYAQSTDRFGYGAADNAAAKEALEAVGMECFAERHLFELSGGEVQAVLIARSLAQGAKFLVLDEPFSHLDLSKSRSLCKRLGSLAHQTGLGVVMSMHDLNEAAHSADTFVLLNLGTLEAAGDAATVYTAEHLTTAYHTPCTTYPHPLTAAPQVWMG